ncbi:hypothetical protein Tco_1337692 [Tanacetum coccineum]
MISGRSLLLCVRIVYDVTPSDTYFVQAPSGGVTDWYQSQVIENQIMAASAIAISSDSSDESVCYPKDSHNKRHDPEVGED